MEETPQCKLLSSPSSTSNQRESTTIASTEKPTCEHKDVEQSKPAHECEDTKQLPSQTSSQPQEIQKSQVLQLSNNTEDKHEDTKKVIHVHAKQPPRETSNESPSVEEFSDSLTAIKLLKLGHNDHIKAYPWAHQASENFSQTTPLVREEEEVEFLNIPHKLFGKYLTIAQKEQMRQVIDLPEVVMSKIG